MKQTFEGPMYEQGRPLSKDAPPPSSRISDPDALFNELFAGTFGPGLIARMFNITLGALLAFAESPATQAKLAAFKRLALQRAELVAAEARLAAAHALFQHSSGNPMSDRARKAASVVFRSTSHAPRAANSEPLPEGGEGPPARRASSPAQESGLQNSGPSPCLPSSTPPP